MFRPSRRGIIYTIVQRSRCVHGGPLLIMSVYVNYLGALLRQLHRLCAYFTFPGDVLTVTAGDCEFLFFWVVRRCLLLLLLYFFVNCRLLRPFTIVIIKDLFTHPPTIPLAIVGKTTRDWSVSGPMYFYIIYILYIAYIYI